MAHDGVGVEGRAVRGECKDSYWVIVWLRLREAHLGGIMASLGHKNTTRRY